MPIIEPDLSETGAIEPGTYAAVIDNVDVGVAKTSGKPKLIIQFGVTVGDKRKPRSVHMPIVGAGAFGLDSLLRACHFDEIANGLKNKDASSRPKFDTDQLIGQKLMVTIENELFNGNQQDKIVGYLRA